MTRGFDIPRKRGPYAFGYAAESAEPAESTESTATCSAATLGRWDGEGAERRDEADEVPSDLHLELLFKVM